MKADREAGFSLAEVLIGSVLTLVVLIMGYQVLSASSSTASTIANRAQNTTAARIAIDQLESDLRYANGLWSCGPVTTTPGTSGTAPSSCPPGTSAVLISNDQSPGCTEWLLDPTAHVLYEVGLGAVSGSSFAVSPITSIAGVQSAAFTLSLPATNTAGSTPVAVGGRLIQISLSVNQEPAAQLKTADSVTVQDLIAPDNLMTADNSSATPCT